MGAGDSLLPLHRHTRRRSGGVWLAGYAQQPPQERFGVIQASLLIGIVWGVFHLPIWFIPGDPHSTYSFFAFTIQTTAISLICALLYNASGQKLTIPVLFHAMWNTAPHCFHFFTKSKGNQRQPIGCIQAFVSWPGSLRRISSEENRPLRMKEVIIEPH
jgi:membrane protease YdiL (CAAX protease family)